MTAVRRNETLVPATGKRGEENLPIEHKIWSGLLRDRKSFGGRITGPDNRGEVELVEKGMTAAFWAANQRSKLS